MSHTYPIQGGPPAPGYPQNPPGYPQNPPGYPQNPPQGQPVVRTQPVVTVVTTPVIRAGNCPKCQNGVVVDRFTMCGICLGFWFFPVGLICMFLMKEDKCSNCGAKF